MPKVREGNHLSASSIGSFKACPVRYRLAYVEGLRPAEDTDSQRMGTNWHSIHEVYHKEIAHAHRVHADILAEFPDAIGDPVDAGHANGLSAVINHLNERYKSRPLSKTETEWALERQQLITCFVGYLWYYANDPIEVLASEVAFELPVYEPRTGMPLPLAEVRRVGKIDHVVKWQGMIGTIERKSTSRTIGPDSDYWERTKFDSQVSMYAQAFRDMARAGTLDPRIVTTAALMGVGAGPTLYDVWHKPTIKPAMLSQKETAEFLASGEYNGQKFAAESGTLDPDGTVLEVRVNGTNCEVEMGKKGFAIRETIEMYGARLLADMQERPDFYFQRREIARTDADLVTFREELYAIYQSQKLMEKHNIWFKNESACRATFACPYIGICHNGAGHKAVADGTTTPPGYKRIFVDLTVNGVQQEE